MTICSYCARPATTTIIANPQHVCLEHAVEFWTALLGYTHDRSGPCVKNERVCECLACEDADASRVRSLAIRSVGPSPGDHVDFAMSIAS